MFYVGMKVNIKPEAWKRFCIENNYSEDLPISPQYITDMPDHSPYHDKFMLSFPLYWWNEDDLIPAENNDDYEEVKSIVINNHTLKIGDKISCCCEYQVVKLHPVWHLDTKKHLPEHPNNSAYYRHLVSKDCVLHTKIK
jgi:hypothetical protein